MARLTKAQIEKKLNTLNGGPDSVVLNEILRIGVLVLTDIRDEIVKAVDPVNEGKEIECNHHPAEKCSCYD